MNGENEEEGVLHVAKRAREAALELQALSSDIKDQALESAKKAIIARRDEIIAANREDKALGEKDVAAGKISKALFKRLDLEGQGKFDNLLKGIDEVKALPDPVGKVTYACQLDTGLNLYRVTSPIGVICMIFEARPEAAVQIASLTLKSSNAVILKGGKEAYHSNKAIVEAIREGLSQVPGFPVDAVQLIHGREEVHSLLSLDRYIDLVIPRGSNKLVRSIQDNTRIPVLGHADGICAVYLDKSIDPIKAIRVTVDSKTQYPAACNAAETLLVHRDILHTVFPKVALALHEAKVSFKADPECLKAIPPECLSGAAVASEEDFDTEFLDLLIAVKAVGSVQEAVQHINAHSSHHTEAIVTEDPAAAEYFLQRVDSAGVYHNASTRFADGQRYGFGAEVGISTNKTHARGPVGVEGLLIYKYKLYGNGDAVSDFSSGKRQFLHQPLPFSSYPGDK